MKRTFAGHPTSRHHMLILHSTAKREIEVSAQPLKWF
jgi:hypothetical protein